MLVSRDPENYTGVTGTCCSANLKLNVYFPVETVQRNLPLFTREVSLGQNKSRSNDVTSIDRSFSTTSRSGHNNVEEMACHIAQCKK